MANSIALNSCTAPIVYPRNSNDTIAPANRGTAISGCPHIQRSLLVMKAVAHLKKDFAWIQIMRAAKRETVVE